MPQDPPAEPSPHNKHLSRVAMSVMPLSRRLWHRLAEVPPIAKPDGTQVTVADYAVQAVLVHALMEAGARFGSEIGFVCEESDEQLQNAGRADVVELCRATVADACGGAASARCSALLSPGPYGAPATDPYWLLDPIDGTSGFIAGSHYSICIALMRGGRAELAAVACPRLAATGAVDVRVDGPGCVVIAERRGGAWLVAEGADGEPMQFARLARNAPWQPPVRWARSMNRRNLPARAEPAIAALGAPVHSIPVDSQVKYALVAMDRADVAVRLPGKNSPEHGWDHIAGALLAEESGARATDIAGRQLCADAHGLMSTNLGVLCAPPELHGSLIQHLEPFARASRAW